MGAGEDEQGAALCGQEGEGKGEEEGEEEDVGVEGEVSAGTCSPVREESLSMPGAGIGGRGIGTGGTV